MAFDSVRPEHVEGPFAHHQGFDKLSPNDTEHFPLLSYSR